VYAALLRAYPVHFVAGTPTVCCGCSAPVTTARASGTTPRFVARAVLDLLLNASLERCHAIRRWFLAPPEGDVIDLRHAAASLSRPEAFQANVVPMTIAVDGDVMPAHGVAVTPGTFGLLGREALIGRTLIVTLLVGMATGLLPAFAGSRADVHATLADGSRGTTGGARRLRSGLVAAEVALALLLATSAGLLVRSFVAVLNVDPGFRTQNLLTMKIELPRRHDTPDKRRELYGRLFERLESVPGVLSVGGTTRLPLGGADSSTQVTIEGREPSRGGLATVGLRRAMHDYFAAMGMPIVRGRGFDRRDGPDAPSVVVVNEPLARRLFPGEDPVGKRMRLAENAGVGLATIVGVVGDVRHDGLEAVPEPEVYIHYLQNPPVAPLIVIRTTTDPARLAESVRAVARDVDPELRPYDIRTMADLRRQAVTERRFLTILATAFGALALLLAMVGVYGVMTLVVTERTQEVGIRLAIGATPGQVLRLVIGDGLRIAAVGAALGLVAAVSLTPLMAAQLYGIGPMDPLTLAGVPIVLLLVACAACLVPARRAMRIDPVTALRYQ
jgi:predicted permease